MLDYGIKDLDGEVDEGGRWASGFAGSGDHAGGG